MSASLRCSACTYSLIGGHLRKEKILKSVVSFFVEHGYLFFEEIVDKLISVDVLQTRHHEILTLAMDRQTRARKIWNLLYYVPPSKFQEHVEPLLRTLGFLKHPVHADLTVRLCLRCAMERFLPLDLLADRLISLEHFRANHYRDLVKSRMFERDKWQLIHQLLQDHKDEGETVSMLSEMLAEVEIPVGPEQLTAILQTGLHCCCNTQETATVPPQTDGPLCADCQGIERQISRQQASRYRHSPAQNRPPATIIFMPEDDTQGDVTMRHDSCQGARAKRMEECENFQRDLHRLSG